MGEEGVIYSVMEMMATGSMHAWSAWRPLMRGSGL